MQLLSVLKTLISLFPLIIQAVQAIESAFPQGSQGAAKLDAVKGVIQSAYGAVQNVEQPFESMWPAIQGVVSTVVTLANATGLFKTSTPSA